MKETTLKKNKGITLIALIISIIILLILATVSITQLTNNGIIVKSKNAVERNEIAEEKETIKLAVTSWKMGKYSNSTKQIFAEFLKAEIPIESEVTEFNGDSKTAIVKIKRNGHMYKVTEDGNIDEGGRLISFIFNEEGEITVGKKVEGEQTINKNTDFWFDLDTTIQVTYEVVSKEITKAEDGTKENISIGAYLNGEEINQAGTSIQVKENATYTVSFMPSKTLIYLSNGTVITDDKTTLSRICK